jgi:hypothetical protein
MGKTQIDPIGSMVTFGPAAVVQRRTLVGFISAKFHNTLLQVIVEIAPKNAQSRIGPHWRLLPESVSF